MNRPLTRIHPHGMAQNGLKRHQEPQKTFLGQNVKSESPGKAEHTARGPS